VDVTVICYGALRESIDGERETRLQLGPRADVDEIIGILGIDSRSVFQVLVNEEQASRGRELREGDTVTLMPPFTGG
jgi:molybdopterin converting factor small subunit